jgi:hypothetical protein
VSSTTNKFCCTGPACLCCCDTGVAPQHPNDPEAAAAETANAAAVLAGGGAAARQLVRERLAGLRRLRSMTQQEGISVWWLELGKLAAPPIGTNHLASLS